MDKFIGVKIYKKEPLNIEGSSYGVYFSDNKSRDWYQVRKEWSAAVMVDPETNLICATEKDVDLMTVAEGMDIYEVAVEDIPNNLVIGSFKYTAGEFVEEG